MNLPPSAILLTKWGAALGFVCGVLYAFGGLVYDLQTTGVNPGTALAFGALVGMPLLFAAVGFVLGSLGALATRLRRRA